MPASARKISMAARTELRKAVRAAVLAEAKRTTIYATATRLEVSKRVVEFWRDGSWPSYPTSRRLAPLVGVPLP